MIHEAGGGIGHPQAAAASLAGALAWWALSLPSRLAVYQEGLPRPLRRAR